MYWTHTIKPFMERHFFGPADGRTLNLFRILFCGVILWRVLVDAPPLHQHYNTVAWNPIPSFELLGIQQLSAEAFWVWQWILVAALAMTCVGLFTRVSAMVACIAFFVYIGNYLGFTKCVGDDYVYHSKNIVFFILFILSLAPGVAMWSFDRLWRGRAGLRTDENQVVSAWPTQLIKLLLAIAYFGAGYSKVASSPLWADGYTLQAYLVQKHLLIDNFNSLWLAEHWYLCLALGIATLVFELTFFIIVFRPNLTWLYVVAGLGFHLSILISMEINFFPYFGASYLVFLEWQLIQRALCWIRGVRVKALPDLQPSSSLTNVGPIGNTRFAMGLILALWIVSDACVFLKVEAWPLSDYGVFRRRNRLSSVSVIRMAGVDSSGKVSFLKADEFPMGERLGWWINYSRMRRYLDKPELQAETFSGVTEYVRKKYPGRYTSMVAVQRYVEGTPGKPDFVIKERLLLEQPIAMLPATLPPVTRIANAAGETLQR